MLNHITIMGRLVADPELRTTQNGIPVTSFRIAVERNYAGQDGERETDFFDVTAWRGTAEIVCEYFAKGRMAVVEGRLQLRDWTDREGGKRRSAEVVADNIYFGDSKRDGEGGGSYSTGSHQGGSYNNALSASTDPFGGYGAPPADGDQFAELTTDDGDLPF